MQQTILRIILAGSLLISLSVIFDVQTQLDEAIAKFKKEAVNIWIEAGTYPGNVLIENLER